MNIVSSTKLRSNLAVTLGKVKKEKYRLISVRGKVKFGVLDFEYLKNLLKGVNEKMLIELEKAQREFE
ncbi:hypothetical protein KBC75_01275 [Candidatus Shapirobacteria bacterium]|nr:hypothetical protein [Candidatus Shapirobacteria bacterium]